MDYDWSDFHYSAQIKIFKVTIVGLFQLYEDIPAFKNYLRDFLVEIKVVRVGTSFSFCLMLTDVLLIFVCILLVYAMYANLTN